MHLKQLEPHLEDKEYALNTLYFILLVKRKASHPKKSFIQISIEQLEYVR